MKIKDIILIVIMLLLIGLIFYIYSYQDGPIKLDIEGKIVTSKEINLDKYDTNIILTKGKEYTLKGSIKHSIIINSYKDVTLNLDNVNIESNDMGSIINVSTNKLTINLNDNTTNNLSTKGKSDYNSAIYSNGPIIINGQGNLVINSKQKKGEGIATKDNDITINNGNITITSKDDGINTGGSGGTITINNGNIDIDASGDGIDSNNTIIINGGNLYVLGSSKGGDAALDSNNGIIINGGVVIGLGVDMLEIPKSTSKQNFIAENINDTIKKDSLITLSDENVVLSFKAKRDFKTILISNNKITNKKYYLYTDNELIKEIN